MEDRNAVVVRNAEEMRTSESEVVNIIVFDKDAMYQDLTDGLKDFGVGCCEAGKKSLSALASTMVKHFFNWVICSILK